MAKEFGQLRPQFPEAPHGRGGRRAHRSQPSASGSFPRLRISRKGLLMGAGALALLGGGAYLQTRPENQEVMPTLRPNPEFSGDVEQTKNLLDQWNAEVGSNPQKFKEYLPRLTQLAAAYFAKEMGEILPDKKDYYTREEFLSKIHLLNEKALQEKYRESACGELNPAYAGFTVSLEGNVYISPDRMYRLATQKTQILKSYFNTLIHESLHAHAKAIFFPPETRLGDIEELSYRSGLTLLTKNKERSRIHRKDCHDSLFSSLEEAAVQYVVDMLCNKVNVYGVEVAPQLNRWIRQYKEKILSYFDGDFKKAFRYHQESDPIGFVSEIGKKEEEKTKKTPSDPFDTGFWIIQGAIK